MGPSGPCRRPGQGHYSSDVTWKQGVHVILLTGPICPLVNPITCLLTPEKSFLI